MFGRRFGVLFVVAVFGFVIIIGRQLLIGNGGKRLLFLLLFGFQFVVIGRFFDTELLIEIVVGDRQLKVGAQLREYALLCGRVDVLLLGETELSAKGIDAHALKYVRHVVIEHIEDVSSVGLRHSVLHLLVYRAERLRSVF